MLIVLCKPFVMNEIIFFRTIIKVASKLLAAIADQRLDLCRIILAKAIRLRFYRGVEYRLPKKSVKKSMRLKIEIYSNSFNSIQESW